MHNARKRRAHRIENVSADNDCKMSRQCGAVFRAHAAFLPADKFVKACLPVPGNHNPQRSCDNTAIPDVERRRSFGGRSRTACGDASSSPPSEGPGCQAAISRGPRPCHLRWFFGASRWHWRGRRGSGGGVGPWWQRRFVRGRACRRGRGGRRRRQASSRATCCADLGRRDCCDRLPRLQDEPAARTRMCTRPSIRRYHWFENRNDSGNRPRLHQCLDDSCYFYFVGSSSGGTT